MAFSCTQSVYSNEVKTNRIFYPCIPAVKLSTRQFEIAAKPDYHQTRGLLFRKGFPLFLLTVMIAIND
jgi:hypothetical protein